MAGGKRGARAPAAGRAGPAAAPGPDAAAAGEPGPASAAQGDLEQGDQPSRPAAASSGPTGSTGTAGRRGTAAATAAAAAKQPQLDARGARQVKETFQQYCRGQPDALIKLLQGQEPNRLTLLLRARLLLSEACHHALQEKDLFMMDMDLQGRVHGALDFAVLAATHEQQPSLLGAAYATTLLRLLHGRPSPEIRRALWQRLADCFPAPLRQQLTAAHFVPADQEALFSGVLDMDWPLDAAVVAARSTADGMAAWAAQQIRELQQLLSQGLDADERDSEIWRRLERGAHKEEILQELEMGQLQKLVGALTNRLANVQTLLPSRSRGKLVVRLAQEKRRVDERLRQQEQQLQQMEGVHWVLQQDEMKRRMAWVQQLQKDVRERLSAAGVAGEQEQQRLVLEVGRAGVKTARLASFLSIELLAADVRAGGGKGGSEERQQLRALVRLASMPLVELRQQLAQVAQPGEALADDEAALLRHVETQHALMAVLAGQRGVEYRLPAEEAGASAQAVSRRAFQRTALETAGSPPYAHLPSDLLEQAGLGDVLQLLSAGDDLPTELPAQAPCHLIEKEHAELDLPAYLASMQRMEVHPDDMEVLLEVPPWRSQPGAPGALSSSAPGSSGSVHCVDDPHTRVLFAAQEQARDATTKLGNVVQDMGMMPLRHRVRSMVGVVDPGDCLSKLLAGHIMVEASMEAGGPAPAIRAVLSSGRSSVSDSDATDSSEEEEERPSAPRSPGGGISPELAQRLARLQLAMDASSMEALHCMVQHCLQDQSAHLRATKSLQTLGQHNMDPASAFFPLEEGGQLLLTLLPLPYQLPKLVEGAAADQEAMEALRQARLETLKRILAALRLLRCRDRLPSLLVSHLRLYLDRAAEHRGVQLAADAGGQDEERLPLEVLPRLPLRDLLNLYSFLATWVAHTFAAGPADLGPASEEAIVLAAAGSNVAPGPGPLAGDRRAAQLSLTPLGLCQMVARTERADVRHEPQDPLLLHRTQRRLPLHPPKAAAFADSLASCAGGLTAALEAAVSALEEGGPVDERGQFELRLQQLAMARWWQELLDRSICSLKLELQSLLGLKHIAAEMSRVNWQTMLGVQPEHARSVLCGRPGQRGCLEEAQQLCTHTRTKFCSAMLGADVTQMGLAALGQRLSSAMMEQELILLLDRHHDASHIKTLKETLTSVREHAATHMQYWHAQLDALSAAAEGNLPVRSASRLAAALVRRQEMFQGMQRAAASCPGYQLVPLISSFVRELHNLQTCLQEIDEEVVLAFRQLHTLHWAATNSVNAALGHMRMECATCPLAVLTKHMVEQALPERWQREVKAQEELHKQLRQQAQQQVEARQQAEEPDALPPEQPQPEASSAPPPMPPGAQGNRAGASSSSSQQPEQKPRGQKGQRRKAAAAQAAAGQQQDVSEEEFQRREAAMQALLREEEEQDERKKKLQQKQEESKKKAAQKKAAQAAAAAAEAKRKADEEAAAEAEAARAADEARREAERRRQEEEEEQRRKENYEALLAAERAAKEEEQRAAAAAAVAAADRAVSAAGERGTQQEEADGVAGTPPQGADEPAAEATPQPKPAREQRSSRQGQRTDKPAADAGAAVNEAAAGSSQQPAAAGKHIDASAASATQAAAQPETPAPSAAAAGKRRGSGALAECAPAASSEASADRQPADGQQAKGAAPSAVQPAAAQHAQQGKPRRQPKAPSPQPDQGPDQRPEVPAVDQPRSAPLPQPQHQQLTQQRQQQQEQQRRQKEAAVQPQQAVPQHPAQAERQRVRGQLEEPSAAQVPDWQEDAELAALPRGPDGEPDIAAVEALFRRREAGRAGRAASPPPASTAPGGWAEAQGGRRAAVPPCGAPAAAPPGSQTAVASAAGAGRDRKPQAEQAPEPARFVSWTGAWVCECGRQHAELTESCGCGMEDPCRRWFYGEPCAGKGRGPCRKPHLLFALPDRPSLEDNVSRHKQRPNKPDPQFVYRPPPKPAAPAAWPRSQAVPSAREAPHAAAAATSSQWPAPPRPASAAAKDAQAPAMPSRVWPRPLLEPEAGTGSNDPAFHADPPSVLQQQPAASAPVPPLGFQPAADLPAFAAAFPPQRRPLPATLAAAAAVAAAPAAAAAAVAAAPAAAAAEDDDLDGLLANMGVSSSSVDQPAQPLLPGPLHQLGALVPNAAGWGAVGAGSASVAQPQVQRLPWHAPGASVWGTAEQAATAAVPVEVQQGSWSVATEHEEDAELAAAIRASMASAAAVATQQQAGAWQQVGRHGAQRPEQAAHSTAEVGGEVSLAGMRNETGEYNCFINVIIQCLWRCAEFRRQVAGWDADFRSADPVVHAVCQLFQQFEAQEAARRASSGTVVVDPTPLRTALAALPGHNFRVGEMNDAAEVLLCIYEKAMDVAKALGRRSGIDETFGLQVREAVNCGSCGRTTQQKEYTQYFYNTQATTLRLLGGLHPSLGALLAKDAAQHLKSCDTDVRGCGQPNPVTHELQAVPRVFTLQVAWQSHNEAPADIAGTLAAIRETVDVGEVYSGLPRGQHRYALRSMVCYYGAHYEALVLVREAGGACWLKFDDKSVSRVGDWQAVRRKCEAGRIQPSVLFYEALPAPRA